MRRVRVAVLLVGLVVAHASTAAGDDTPAPAPAPATPAAPAPASPPPVTALGGPAPPASAPAPAAPAAPAPASIAVVAFPGGADAAWPLAPDDLRRPGAASRDGRRDARARSLRRGPGARCAGRAARPWPTPSPRFVGTTLPSRTLLDGHPRAGSDSGRSWWLAPTRRSPPPTYFSPRPARSTPRRMPRTPLRAVRLPPGRRPSGHSTAFLGRPPRHLSHRCARPCWPRAKRLEARNRARTPSTNPAGSGARSVRPRCSGAPPTSRPGTAAPSAIHLEVQVPH